MVEGWQGRRVLANLSVSIIKLIYFLVVFFTSIWAYSTTPNITSGAVPIKVIAEILCPPLALSE